MHMPTPRDFILAVCRILLMEDSLGTHMELLVLGLGLVLACSRCLIIITFPSIDTDSFIPNFLTTFVLLEQPVIYGRGPTPSGMHMVPMVLPDGRIGYVL